MIAAHESTPFRAPAPPPPAGQALATVRLPVERRVAGALTYFVLFALLGAPLGLAPSAMVDPSAPERASALVGSALLLAVVAWAFGAMFRRRVGAHLTVYPDRVVRHGLRRDETFPFDALHEITLVTSGPDGALDLAFADGRSLSLRSWPREQLESFGVAVSLLAERLLARVRRGEEVVFVARRGESLRYVASAVGCFVLGLPGLRLGGALGPIVALFAAGCGLLFLRLAWIARRSGCAVSAEGVRSLQAQGAATARADFADVEASAWSILARPRGGAPFHALTDTAPNYLVLQDLLVKLGAPRVVGPRA